MAFTVIKKPLYLVITWITALVYLVAGTQKLFDPSAFVVLIDSYGLVWEPFLLPIAVLLPLFEIVAAIALLLKKRWAMIAIGGLTLMFIAVLSYGIWLGLDIDCGCFGVGDPEREAYSNLHSALVKNVIILAGIGYLLVFHKTNLVRFVRNK